MGRCHDGASICLQCLFLGLKVLKAFLNGILFLSKMTCVTDMLKTIPVEDFQRCYQNWKQRLHQCAATQGNYFEGDSIDFSKT